MYKLTSYTINMDTKIAPAITGRGFVVLCVLMIFNSYFAICPAYIIAHLAQ